MKRKNILTAAVLGLSLFTVAANGVSWSEAEELVELLQDNVGADSLDEQQWDRVSSRIAESDLEDISATLWTRQNQNGLAYRLMITSKTTADYQAMEALYQQTMTTLEQEGNDEQAQGGTWLEDTLTRIVNDDSEDLAKRLDAQAKLNGIAEVEQLEEEQELANRRTDASLVDKVRSYERIDSRDVAPFNQSCEYVLELATPWLDHTNKVNTMTQLVPAHYDNDGDALTFTAHVDVDVHYGIKGSFEGPIRPTQFRLPADNKDRAYYYEAASQEGVNQISGKNLAIFKGACQQ